MGLIELQDQFGFTRERRERSKLLRKSLIFSLGIVLLIQFYIIPTYLYKASPSALKLSSYHTERLKLGLARCADITAPKITRPSTDAKRVNPRHNSKKGQKKATLLRNATLFDGEKIISGPVDISFEDGIITAVLPASSGIVANNEYHVLEVNGGWVTPGMSIRLDPALNSDMLKVSLTCILTTSLRYGLDLRQLKMETRCPKAPRPHLFEGVPTLLASAIC